MTDMILAIRQDFTVLPSWTGECRPSQLKTIRTAAIHSGQAAACPWSRSNERAGLGAGSTGFVFAFANCGLFMAYIVLGHRIANAGGERFTGIDQLGAAMAVAAVAATPWGLGNALPAFRNPVLLLAGAGVGVCSSVIPYVCDQLAMAGLPRATFSLMLALLPVFATVIGAVVLRQFPTFTDAAGIALVVLGVALHQASKEPSKEH